MRRVLVSASFVCCLAFIYCSDPVVGPTDLTEPAPGQGESALVVAGQSSTSRDVPQNFVAPLEGRQEVPPVDTKATGVAKFQLSKDGDELSYKLIVANIQGVTQSHIHIGAAGTNGPVVVFLFGFDAAGVTVNGILAQGIITQSNLIPRSSIGFGGTMEELVAAMSSGNAYVNVHTLAHPTGEIRGQIK